MILLGIDPDLKGGLATIDMGARKILSLHRMPVYEPPVKGKGAKRLDTLTAWACIQQAKHTHGAIAAVLEAAIVKPQIGKGGRQAMMGSVGRIHQTYGALLAMCEITFGRAGVIKAWPSAWKKEMKLTADKSDSRVLACSLYPAHAQLLDKVKNEGMAEAVLLTEWGKVRVVIPEK